jgi:AAA+ superfamily predicted ATPase
MAAAPVAESVAATSIDSDWTSGNQAYLGAALREIAEHLGRSGGSAVRSRRDVLDPPAAVDVVTSAFGLSDFERAVLLLCAGPELDSSFATLVATAVGDASRPWPTFSLALARLPGAHWSALSPDRPLRHWRLIEVTGHGPLTQAPLRVDEHILHFLAGVNAPDQKLAGLVRVATESGPPTAGQHGAAHAVVALWRRPGSALPVLIGADGRTRVAVAVHAASDAGLRLAIVDGAALPAEPAAREELARLLERSAALTSTVFLIECGESADAVDAVAAATQAPLALSADDPPPLRQTAACVVDVPRATPEEQRDVWRRETGGDVGVESLVAAFDLDAPSIRAAAAVGRSGPASIWDACRAIDRPRLSAHAQRIEPAATWADLVVPEAARQSLALLCAHARHRVTVYHDWKMSKGRSVGLGTAAVFSGPSGTGKTFAAEVVAADLGVDLYRVDLSAVVSKYIGETEKNLRRVFDAAEHGSAVLLFDEADALFGKRTEVRDSHDRYANVEVSYLLQRMESYRGVAILTTNMAEGIDAAFLRRVRFLVDFPFPDRRLRVDLWRRAFPPETPKDGLDVERLAELELSGGSIRNVSVNAAFMAAAAGEPVRTAHVLQAVRIESSKLGQPLATVRRSVES